MAETMIELKRSVWGRPYLIQPSGERIDDVSIVPLFPISDPHRWIAIVAPDGHEVAMVVDPTTLSQDSASLLVEELTYRDFVPRITRVVSVSGTSEPCEWCVETNHGTTRFVLKSEEDIRRLSVHEVMIVDANGGRYRVDDTHSSMLDRVGLSSGTCDQNGVEGSRTPDLRIANATLSQLSYHPLSCYDVGHIPRSISTFELPRKPLSTLPYETHVVRNISSSSRPRVRSDWQWDCDATSPLKMRRRYGRDHFDG